MVDKELNSFLEHYEAWFDKHSLPFSEELDVLRKLIPPTGEGFEIGIGTGRYAIPLGIKKGIEPVKGMRDIAATRGLEVEGAIPELLPFANERFDFALNVNLHCLEDAPLVMREIYRVLKPAGAVIIGFIEQKSNESEACRNSSAKSFFMRCGSFCTADSVKKLLASEGFGHFILARSSFGSSRSRDSSTRDQGYSEGSLTFIKGIKHTAMVNRNLSDGD